MKKSHRMALSQAQRGNVNAAKPEGTVRTSFLVARCFTTDRTAWSQAANKADARGDLKEMEKSKRAKSVLAAWAILTLNRAADKQNTPEEREARQRAEAERIAAETEPAPAA